MLTIKYIYSNEQDIYGSSCKVKKNPRIFCTIFYGNSFLNWEFLFYLGIPFLIYSIFFYVNCVL